MAEDDWSWRHWLEALCTKKTISGETSGSEGHSWLSERVGVATHIGQSWSASNESRGLRGASWEPFSANESVPFIENIASDQEYRVFNCKDVADVYEWKC